MLFNACSKYDSELESALALAGENRAELERVLDHYADDDEKWTAARYLIVNMVDTYSEDPRVTEACAPFYQQYDSLMQVHGYDSLLRIFDYGKMKLWDKQVDSLWADFASRNAEQLTYAPLADLQSIPAQRFITEIDQAFKMWKSNVHTRHDSFDNFLEFILPFRHRNGLLIDSTRQVFRERHAGKYFAVSGKYILDEIDSLLYEYRHITHSGFAGTRIPVLNTATMEQMRHALCEQRCWFNSMLLTSLGMAVTTDFVPAWGNRNNSHTWNVMFCEDRAYAFETFWDKDRWKYKRIYTNDTYDLDWGRYRLPKVYRYTSYRLVEGPIADKDIALADIPALFRNVHKYDVSREYFKTVNVSVTLQNIPASERYAYLCVLNYGNWDPVQWGRIDEEGKATFEDMGMDILYRPMYCRGGVMLPAGEPFILKKDGSMHYFHKDNNTHDITVNTYSGALSYVPNSKYLNLLKHSWVIGISEDDHRITLLDDFRADLELNTHSWEIHRKTPIRKIDILISEMAVGMGKIEFITQGPDGKNKKIEGVKVLTRLPVSKTGEHIEDILDESSASGYYGNLNGYFLQFDLGDNYTLEHIRACPYLECNFNEGVEYKLCRWDGDWEEIGRKKGRKGRPLQFENVPCGSLLAIMPADNTGRVGWRPFIYYDGEPHWY